MNFKIDTKEKMHVIRPEVKVLTAKMTEAFKEKMLSYLDDEVKNLIIDMSEVEEVEPAVAPALVSIQQEFYDKNHSLVYCKIQKSVEDFLDENELLELMNTTNTESEAWDIVQMEEIEREFL